MEQGRRGGIAQTPGPGARRQARGGSGGGRARAAGEAPAGRRARSRQAGEDRSRAPPGWRRPGRCSGWSFSGDSALLNSCRACRLHHCVPELDDQVLNVVGIVLVSHSAELARGLAELAGQVAGEGTRVFAAGGGPDGTLGTSADGVQAAIDQADGGDGVVILADIGSANLTVTGVLSVQPNGHVRLADAPLVEGAVAA